MFQCITKNELRKLSCEYLPTLLQFVFLTKRMLLEHLLGKVRAIFCFGVAASVNAKCKALAKKKIRKQAQNENLILLAHPLSQALLALALTCVHFGRDQTCTPVDPNFSPFGQPTQVDAVERRPFVVIAIYKPMKYRIGNLEIFFFCDLRVLARKLASPFGTQPQSLRKFNFRLLASPFDHGLSKRLSVPFLIPTYYYLYCLVD